ncbi:Hint domain-containing protein [Aestuariibius insulae]|uniref:Hint domain-containing protein n=1 Tax=Aestuariibius insulae TaxID=2058287 RepID=UPI00345E89F4
MADALLGGIVINEVLADPSGSQNDFDTDGNGTARNTDEFVELFNTSGNPIDISGLELFDPAQGSWFTFPDGTVLQSGGRAVVVAGVQNGGSLPAVGPGNLAFDAGRNNAVLTNSSDTIGLYDPSSNTYIEADYNGGASRAISYPAGATQIGSGDDLGSDIDGFSIQRDPDGSDTVVNDAAPTPGTRNLCFTQDTIFETPDGPRAIEELQPGDLLMTRDRGAQPIRWIWSGTHLSEAIAANPALNAIRIARGALGPNVPSRDIRLSRHHRILLSSKIAARVFGLRDVLVPAKDLLAVPGVDVAPIDGPITYYHILMERHEVLLANGLAAESLFLGDETVKTIPPEALEEIRLLLGSDPIPQPARFLAKGRKARNLVERHILHGRSFLEPSEG